MRTLLILGAIVLVYGSTVSRAGFVYEDHNGGDEAISRLAQDAAGAVCGAGGVSLWRARCLTALSYRVDVLVGGSPRVFHLTSVWLHTVVALVLFALTGSVWAGLVVAVHPMATEAAAYIAARTELIAALGVLLVLGTVSTRLWLLGLIAGVWLAWQGSALTAVGVLLAWPFAARLVGWDGRAALTTAAGVLALAVGAGLLLGPIASPAELTPIDGPWIFIGQQIASSVRLLAQLVVPIGQSIELPAASSLQVVASLGVLVSGSLVAWAYRWDYPRLTSAWAFAVAMLLPRMVIPRYEGLHERHVYAGLVGGVWCLTTPKGLKLNG